MKKVFSSIIFVSMLFGALALNISQAKAESDPVEPNFSLRFENIPENAVITPGYFNNSSTGFRVYAKPKSGFEFSSIALFVDASPVPLDERVFDASMNEYYLSSNTASLAEMKAIVPSGPHTISFRYKVTDLSAYQTFYNFDAISDFSAPEGMLTYQTQNGKTILKISDTVTFRFEPDFDSSGDDIASVMFSFNGRSYQGVLSPDGSYGYELSVTEGDIYGGDRFLSVKVLDKAGNSLSLQEVASFVFDGERPGVVIQNPVDGGRYSSRSLTALYEITGEFVASKTQILLDGVRVDSTAFTDLAEGFHDLKISAEDSSGNLGEKEVRFEIDTSPPGYSAVGLAGGGSFTRSSELNLDGQTEPGARIILEVRDDGLTMETLADSSGHFSFKIPANVLSVGGHDLYLTFYDLLSNNITVKILSFKITAAVADVQPAQLAQARSETKSDISPPVIRPISHQVSKQESVKLPSKVEEVSKVGGQISAASDTRSGINWTIYLLILGLAIIVGAVLTAGYYGYEVISGGLLRSGVPPGKKYIQDESGEDGASLKAQEGTEIKQASHEDESENKQARW